MKEEDVCPQNFKSVSVKFLKHTHPKYFTLLPKITYNQIEKINFWKFWLFEYSENKNFLIIRIFWLFEFSDNLNILIIWMKKIINSINNYSQLIRLSLSIK